MREMLVQATVEGFKTRVLLWDGSEAQGKVQFDKSEPIFRVGRRKINFMNVVEVDRVEA